MIFYVPYLDSLFLGGTVLSVPCPLIGAPIQLAQVADASPAKWKCLMTSVQGWLHMTGAVYDIHREGDADILYPRTLSTNPGWICLNFMAV